MMPINLTGTNLLVYSCFWLFYFFPPLTCFLSSVQSPFQEASACYQGHLCLPAWFLRVGWASPACLAGVLLESYPLCFSGSCLQGQEWCWSDLSVSSPSALFWVYVLASLGILGQAAKALAALSFEGLCEQSRLSPSCSPARLVWGSLEWVEGLSVVQTSQS